MFTGVIEEIGTVRHIAQVASGMRLEVAASHAIERLEVDDGINVSGVRLTVVERDDRGFASDVTVETLSRSTLGSLSRGSHVNLERALSADHALGGHFVQGHVDATSKLIDWQAEGEGSRLRFGIPKDFARYIALGGYIALDGVSLAVTKLTKTYFEIAMLPDAAQRTTLGSLRPGGSVNVEVDLLAKYVERIVRAKSG